jgi:hypothetical protein
MNTYKVTVKARVTEGQTVEDRDVEFVRAEGFGFEIWLKVSDTETYSFNATRLRDAIVALTADMR